MQKRWMGRAMALLLAGTQVLSPVSAYTVQAKPVEEIAGTIYYVSADKGSDTNSGTSESQAFQTLDKINELTLKPGDQVLLEKGSVFENQALHVKGSGNDEAPIKISVYGEGERPKINTNGHGQWELDYGKHLDNKNHKWKGTVSSAILLQDVEYIEISGLELTNDRDAEGNPKDEAVKDYNDADVMDRTGVAGVAKDKGTLDHIVLDDLYIHDVDGNVYNKHMTNGGIYFIVEQPENESKTGVARYNDIAIRNCYLDTVNRWGIAVGYTYQWNQFKTAELSDSTMETYGSSNVVIENNYLNNVGGDAITAMYLDRPIIQYNVSEGAAAQINTSDYAKQQPSLNADTGLPDGTYLPKNNGRVAAGIWPWKCKDAIFQYNECFNTQNAANGNGDGQPWDADYGEGTNYQYNYSHGNTASTIMFCGVESVNNTFRYNISQNEDMGPLDPAGNRGYTHVYNNTFYIKEGIMDIWSTMHANNGPVKMENNIFYFAGDTPVQTSNWNPGGNKTYDNNLYYNVAHYPNDGNAVKVKAGTKVLENPGSGPTEPAAEGSKARDHSDPNQETAFDGYKLAKTSPAINAGKVVIDENGYTIDKDFFGHPITAVPEIGAAESDAGVSLVLRSDEYTITDTIISDIPKNTTQEKFLENLIFDRGVQMTVKDGERTLGSTDIVKGGMTVKLAADGMESVVYTIAASADNDLKSTYYEMDGTTLNVPFTSNNPTTVSQLKQNIVVNSTASVSVLKAGQVLSDSDTVEAGMTVRITAENGDVNDFTVAQKNRYSWTADYAGPHRGTDGTQGNVWFAQMKEKNGVTWEDITEKDPGNWPNWIVDTWSPVGVDGPANADIPADSHGLIGSSLKTDTAMVFRAPKSGYVQFSIKEDEPYFRQENNGNGDRNVTLKIVRNDEIIDSVTLDNLGQNEKVENWTNSKTGFAHILVNKGDYIRVIAISMGNTDRNTIHITPDITYLDIEVEDTEDPEAPQAVRNTQITELGAKIVWGTSLDNVVTVGYNIYVNGEKVNDVPVEESEYVLTGLKGRTTYIVTVTAVDEAGNESEPSKNINFTTEAPSADTETPSAPADVEAKNVTQNSAVITWTVSLDNAKVEGYNVFVDGGKKNINLITDTQYALSGLIADTGYTVEVQAVDALGNTSTSAKVKFKTEKDPSVPNLDIVNKNDLKKNIAMAEILLAMGYKYTEESLADLNSVYGDVLKVYNDKNVKQSHVDEKNSVLLNAIKALNEKKNDSGTDNGKVNGKDNRQKRDKFDSEQNNEKTNHGDSSKIQKAVNTADVSNFALYGLMLVVSTGAAGIALRRKKRHLS